ncbi:hypothetical protein [Salibacterium sp. K-3]
MRHKMGSKYTWIVAAGMIVSLLCVPLQQSEAKGPHAVLVLVPALSMDDVFLLLEEGRLQRGAAAGALNRVTAGPSSPVNELLTLSSGRRAETPHLSLEDWVEKEAEGERSTYILPGFREVRAANEQSGYGAVPGTLGDTLRSAGTVIRFAGHSDIYEKRRSYAPFLTADSEGMSAGNRDAVVDKKRSAPGGWSMNPQKTLDWVDNVQQQTFSSWSVIEWGDIYRAHQKGLESSGGRVLEPLEHLLLELRKKDSPLFLLGVDPSTGDVLPFVMWTKDGKPPVQRFRSTSTGLLYLGSSIDAASAFIKVFSGGDYASALISDRRADLAEMKSELQGMQAIHDSRAAVLSIYISMLVVLLTAGFLYGKWERSRPSRWMDAAVLTGMVSPLAFVLIPALIGRPGPTFTVPAYACCLAAAALILGTAASFINREKAPVVISVLVTALLTVDLLNGADAMQRSYLGYDPLIGARYGGLGNELGGFFAAAAVVCLEPVMRHKKKAVLPLMLGFMMVSGSSALGKNAGVTVASGLMFGSFWMSEIHSAGWKRMLAAGTGAVIGLCALLWLLQFTGGTSHIGAAFQQLFHGEWEELRALLGRKLEMNIKIIFHSNWTQLLLTSYAIAALYLLTEKRIQMRPSQRLVLKAGAAGSIFLLLLNDSGAVAASTSMFYLLCVRYIWSSNRKGTNGIEKAAMNNS